MAKHSPLALLVMCISVLFLAACGGTGATLDTQPAEAQPAPAEVTEISEATFDGLPAIPDDFGESDRQASAAGPPGTTTVLGADYLQMHGGYVEGTALVLVPGDPDPETGQQRPAYGLYRAGGLAGKRPLSLNIECLPAELGQAYFVAVADYTDRHWRWFGPVTFPEFELNLRGIRNQLTTHLGNMYFLIAVAPGNSATHARSTVIWGEPDPGGMPGSPHHLVASDGQFPEAVKLSWVAGGNAAGYEVFRKPVMPEAQWEKIGQTQQTQYMDQPLPDWRMFCYRVRGVSEGGPSGFSNKDTGFAGGGSDPGVIEGDITLIDGQPLAGIHVGIVGMGEEVIRKSNDNGKFWFRDLPPGVYLVAARHPELDFFPPYHAVDLRNRIHAEIHFNAAPTAIFHRVFGFVVTPGSPESDMAIMPLPGVDVTANLLGQPENTISTMTDEHGFYVLDGLSEGINIVRAAEEGFIILPGFHEVVVNGSNPPDRRDFLALPGDGTNPPPPGDPPGDPGGE